MTTIASTARTNVSAIGRAVASPFAAIGAARKTRHLSRTSSTLRLGSLIRSCQERSDLRPLPMASKTRRWSGTVIGCFDTVKRGGLEYLGDDPERVVGVLVIAAVLPFR